MLYNVYGISALMVLSGYRVNPLLFLNMSHIDTKFKESDSILSIFISSPKLDYNLEHMVARYMNKVQM